MPYPFPNGSYLPDFDPSFTPPGLIRPRGPPLPRFSTHPVRDTDYEPWVAATFRHLEPEDAELRRRILRSFLATITWRNHLPLTSPVLDHFVTVTAREIRCGFCDRICYNNDEAIECTKGHLDYHPPPH